jgi:hypothetical protein
MKMRMRSGIAASVLGLLSSAALGSPFDSLPQSAEAFSDAFNQRNFAYVAASTNRTLISVSGSESAVAERIRSSLKDIEYADMQFQVGRRSCSLVSTTVVCVLPYTVVLGGRDGKLLLESFYIASWAPHQQQWYFADGNGVHKEGVMKILFPAYAGEPRIPEKIRPRRLLPQ